MSLHKTVRSSAAIRIHSWLISLAKVMQSPVLLFLRLTYGWEMYLSGLRHLQHVPATVQQFKDWGIPLPMANVYISGMTEMIGGSLLLAGLATRLIAAPLVFNFIVAIATAGAANVHQLFHGGDMLSNYSAGRLGGAEAVIDDTAFPFLMTALLLFAFGAGKISIDFLIQQWLFRGSAPPGVDAKS